MNAVDTNVLIYASDARDQAKQARADELIGALQQPVLLWQVACEYIAASHKLADQGFTSADAWQQITLLKKAWRFATPTIATLDQAELLHLKRGVSIWDALLYAACREAGVTRIYSEDLPGGFVPGLEIVNPFV